MQSKNSIKVYGLTHDTVKNDYMLAYDEFNSKRSMKYGKCANCN